MEMEIEMANGKLPPVILKGQHPLTYKAGRLQGVRDVLSIIDAAIVGNDAALATLDWDLYMKEAEGLEASLSDELTEAGVDTHYWRI